MWRRKLSKKSSRFRKKNVWHPHRRCVQCVFQEISQQVIHISQQLARCRSWLVEPSVHLDQELRRKRNRSSGAKFPTPLRKRLDTAELALDLSQNTEGYTSSGKRRKTSIVIEPILQGVTGDFPAPVLTKRHGWHWAFKWAAGPAGSYLFFCLGSPAR